MMKWYENQTTPRLIAIERCRIKHIKKYLDELEERCDKEYERVSKSGDEYSQGEAFGKLCLVVEIINNLFKEEEK